MRAPHTYTTHNICTDWKEKKSKRTIPSPAVTLLRDTMRNEAFQGATEWHVISSLRLWREIGTDSPFPISSLSRPSEPGRCLKRAHCHCSWGKRPWNLFLSCRMHTYHICSFVEEKYILSTQASDFYFLNKEGFMDPRTVLDSLYSRGWSPFLILLPLFPQSWDYKHAPSCLAQKRQTCEADTATAQIIPTV